MSCNTQQWPKIGEEQSGLDYWWTRANVLKELLHDREDKLRVILSHKHEADFMHSTIQTKQEWKCGHTFHTGGQCKVEYRDTDILVLYDTIMVEGT